MICVDVHQNGLLQQLYLLAKTKHHGNIRLHGQSDFWFQSESLHAIDGQLPYRLGILTRKAYMIIRALLVV